MTGQTELDFDAPPMTLTTRDTSVAAYHAIESEGLLSEWRLRVYQTVFRHGPMTSGEAFQMMQGKLPSDASPLSQSRARFTELRDRGVLKETDERPCRVSGRMCIEWDVTSALPHDPIGRNKPPTRAEFREAAIELRAIFRERGDFSPDLQRVCQWISAKGQ